MKADKLRKIQQHAQAIAELLYEETASEQVQTLEGIEEVISSNSHFGKNGDLVLCKK